jgi:DNA-binding NarL/FixJ family response regulator
VFVALCVHDALAVGHVDARVNDSFGVVQSLAVIAFPLCIAFGMWQADAARMRVTELLPARLSTSDLQTALRSLLADPLLEIRAGAAASLPVAPSLRSTPLLSEGRQVGVLIHGPALTAEPDLLRVAAAAAADSLATRRPDPRARDAVARLSMRQREVLALLADGHSNDTIAQRLGISIKTVEKHVRNIYDVLDLPPELRLNRRVGATVTWLDSAVEHLSS